MAEAPVAAGVLSGGAPRDLINGDKYPILFVMQMGDIEIRDSKRPQGHVFSATLFYPGVNYIKLFKLKFFSYLQTLLA